MIAVSVVISTYNRSEKLARLLESVGKAAASALGTPVEIVVVDNRSTDDTRAIVERFADSVSAPVRYVFEGRPGKSFGLNAGLAVAQGELLALTDDDIVVAENWISMIQEEFRAGRDVDILGGRVELYDSTDLPITVVRSQSRARYGLETLAPNEIPVLGANLVFRRAILERVGPFDTRLGPGTGLVAEDLDYLYRVLRAGYHVTYSPDVVVFHGHERKSAADMASVMGGYFRGRGAFYTKYIARLDRRVVRYAWWELRALLRATMGAGSQAAYGRRRALTDVGSILRGSWLYLRRG